MDDVNNPTKTAHQIRAAHITYRIFQNRLLAMPGLSTKEIADEEDAHWNNIDHMMRELSKHPSLPIYRDRAGAWRIRVAPWHLWEAEQEYTYIQRASLATHRLICWSLFEDNGGLTKRELAPSLGLTPSGIKQLLMNISCAGGIPLYYDHSDSYRWKMCLDELKIAYCLKDRWESSLNGVDIV